MGWTPVKAMAAVSVWVHVVEGAFKKMVVEVRA
jgi:hypothetical protein